MLMMPDLVVGVWVGHDDDRPIPGLSGSGLPAEIWRRFMADAHDGLQVKQLPGVSGFQPRPVAREIAPAPEGKPARQAPKPNPVVIYEYPDAQENDR